MVEYDSIIQPGRVGKVTGEVNVNKLHGESFRKSITVVSNAENVKGTLSLSLKGTIKAIVSMSKHYARLKDRDSSGDPFELVLKTEKKDFEVLEIKFKNSKRSNSAPMWQKDLPIAVDFKVSRKNKPDKNGYYEFTVKMSTRSSLKETAHGEFVIVTNHPEKKELTLRGMIEVPN